MKHKLLFTIAIATALGSTIYGMQKINESNAQQEINFCDFPEEINFKIAKVIIKETFNELNIASDKKNNEKEVYELKKIAIQEYGKLSTVNKMLAGQFFKKISHEATQMFYLYLKTDPEKGEFCVFNHLDTLFRKNKKFLTYVDFRHKDEEESIKIIITKENPPYYHILLAEFKKNTQILNDKASLLIGMSQKIKNSGDTHLPLELELITWKDDAVITNDIVEKQVLWIENPKQDQSWCSIL